MRLPGAKVCVLNFAAPAGALCLTLSAAACGSPAQNETGAESRQTQTPELRDVISFEGARKEASTHVIKIKSFKFVPEIINAKKGDRIRWINLDVVPHTATADDKRWNSGAIANQAQWSLTVDEAGVIDYICAYHPSMIAKLIVEE